MKIGRNEPCHCGSGKKYKKCCLQNDLEKEETAKTSEKQKVAEPVEDRSRTDMEQRYQEVQELDDISNSAIDLIHAKRFDEAEKVCERLLRDYPDQVDGLERMARLFEAKGDKKRAAHYHRQTMEFMRSHGGFDPENIEYHIEQAERLDKELGN